MQVITHLYILDEIYFFDILCWITLVNQQEERIKIKSRALIFYHNEARHRHNAQHHLHHHQIYINSTPHPLPLPSIVFPERIIYSISRAEVVTHLLVGVHGIEGVMIATTQSRRIHKLKVVAFYHRTIQ